MVTTTVSAGRPTLVARTIDLGAGVDPLSLVIAYGRVLIGAVAYDPATGFAVFPLPASVPALQAGRTPIVLASGDFQEDKNVDQAGDIETILPNTAFVSGRLNVVNGPTVQWLVPERLACVPARTRLLVVAGSTRKIRSVYFGLSDRKIATVRRGVAGLYSATLDTRRLSAGLRQLFVRVTDTAGMTADAIRYVRVCARK
jgi:hypothetical protein